MPNYSQHAGSSPPHETSFLPMSAERIIAVAHPTPLLTVTAPAGQLSWQAPHSMQASCLTIWTLPFPGANTPWGQTSRHAPQFTQSDGLNFNVLTGLSTTS